MQGGGGHERSGRGLAKPAPPRSVAAAALVHLYNYNSLSKMLLRGIFLSSVPIRTGVGALGSHHLHKQIGLEWYRCYNLV